MFWARVKGMTFSQTLIGSPHDLLKLKELGEEAGETVVDLWRILRDYDNMSAHQLATLRSFPLTLWMGVSLDDPQRVGLDRILVAGDLLLLKTPIGELNLVRK